ncbi:MULTISPECIES: flagellar basal body L-ring protein FlgH [unclassified Herbaspirillum]|uniref:flagellar basal body L-ring protein FlgH n=1 Tax=unclassified Herbaspirillum TaxID=2624150 RepID=UPI00115271CC|nr:MULTISPECIES: flagellar basal body L-ring protein FlgH [unclassified Herbaspirillum]MBB5392913.1 flagellar L-ring protein precursor FlgH [Herbaspirillum sp. SJZ102]TQK04441.1 flagellar L-ring protein precursor FlgH [Herbaspirillum sp. SJZ130]TQK09774.1 flagellar L-ring protein precursor FlgH [Herbaspirillum sp. SJZ106]
MNRLLKFAAVVGTFAVAGCNTVPESIVKGPMTARPQPASYAPATSGAIFQSAVYRPLLEDRRARLVGDTLTIVINERTSAGKTAGSSASKTGTVASPAPTIFGTTIKELSASGTSSNKFEDKGAVSSSNTFTGTIGVTVTEVLPNGNLVVSGEKQVALDKGVEYVRFSGTVSPDNIQTGNTVSSTVVSDAKVEYRTNTRVDMAEFMSSLGRFFFSVSPF